MYLVELYIVRRWCWPRDKDSRITSNGPNFEEPAAGGGGEQVESQTHQTAFTHHPHHVVSDSYLVCKYLSRLKRRRTRHPISTWAIGPAGRESLTTRANDASRFPGTERSLRNGYVPHRPDATYWISGTDLNW
ncbi:hypothetical protein PGT21_003468 [Puccinia graminis f. sp. tritici]|uniref:Uncharacterized protein n=1 Tax=Puccinia graminis f. sp. tritici TaxID=56615 RepID=A0A5B0MU90_PUCGR|nr:hypothetical protein PGT21_003468 [Puccinia graminis f. sp. tritici]KAA1079983.1 hypothetical protein PGTUg99_017886 [Puccinia graminis f. sp. tritici]